MWKVSTSSSGTDPCSFRNVSSRPQNVHVLLRCCTRCATSSGCTCQVSSWCLYGTVQTLSCSPYGQTRVHRAASVAPWSCIRWIWPRSYGRIQGNHGRGFPIWVLQKYSQALRSICWSCGHTLWFAFILVSLFHWKQPDSDSSPWKGGCDLLSF